MDAGSFAIGFLGAACPKCRWVNAGKRELALAEAGKLFCWQCGGTPAVVAYVPPDPVGGIGRTPQPWWINHAGVPRPTESWEAAQQQEASIQRSDEAMGSLGNVPSNVVSKEG